jgi:hypothetical protein
MHALSVLMPPEANVLSLPTKRIRDLLGKSLRSSDFRLVGSAGYAAYRVDGPCALFDVDWFALGQGRELTHSLSESVLDEVARVLIDAARRLAAKTQKDSG